MSDRPPLPEPFRCDVVQADGEVLVELIGELDLATSPLLERALEDVAASAGGRVVVDLRGLTFMDSTGLRVLMRWDLAGREAGLERVFIAGPDAVQRVFEATRLLERVTFVDPPQSG
jgi:anti-sigma B factor antagonist